MAIQIQIHIRMPKPGLGIRYSSDLLDSIADAWLKGKKLPKQISVSAIEWRSGVGPWKEARERRHIERVRRDFQYMAQAGFSFTGIQEV